jgi:hypothetical protein
MTMPFAPGGSPGQPQYQPPMQPGYQYAQQPGYAPPPAYQQAPPPAYTQPQYQQPQQQPQQMPQQLQGSDLNQRLYGPGIPAELQGKTVGEGLRYYGIMREEFIRRGQQPQQQAPQFQQQPQQQPQQFQQPQGQPSAQPRGPQQPQGDPMRQYVEEAIRQVMPEMLAPVVQPIQQQHVQRVYQETKSKYPDWAQHEAVIIQSMQGADPPGAWETAYRHAVGDAIVRQRQGQQQPQGQGYQPYGSGPPQQQYQQQLQQFDPQAQYRPPQMQGANGAPTFVESPTPPPPQMPQQGYDPADEMAAKRFNIPVEVYRSWKGGRIGLLHQPSQGIQPQNAYGQPQLQMQPQMQNNYPPQPQYPPQGFPQVPPGYYQPPTQNGVGYNGRY